MDLTPLEHVGIALAAAAIIGWPSKNWYAGAAAGIAFFIGREHTQAEYRWIEAYGKGLRANMPWWGGFDVRVWNVGSLLDWGVPMLACVAMMIVVYSVQKVKVV